MEVFWLACVQTLLGICTQAVFQPVCASHDSSTQNLQMDELLRKMLNWLCKRCFRGQNSVKTKTTVYELKRWKNMYVLESRVQAELAFTSPVVIPTSPKSFLTSKNWFHSSSVIQIPQKTSLACRLPGKLKTEFTSPKTKSTSPELSDTTFFARWGQTCSSNNSHRSS